MTEPLLTPRGIRNNNPGNIRRSDHWIWNGQTGADADGFCIFADPVMGLRAGIIIWCHYRQYYGASTARDYIARWAPSSENNVGEYATYVAAACDVGPDDPLDIDNDAVRVMQAVVRFENGTDPYDLKTYFAAVTASHQR